MKINIIKNNTKIRLHLGIQILRIIFSFHILVFHCINKKKYKSKFVKSVDIDLKTFFIISFFFSHDTFASRNILKIYLRFKRLLIPYILWPIIFLIINNIKSIRNINLFNNIKYLFYQILIGIGINNVFWFQFNLIFISIFFLIIIFLIKKRYMFILTIIEGLCFLLNISSNKIMHLKFNCIAYFSISPIPSSFICLFFGFYLSSIKIIDRINNYKCLSIILCSSIICFYIIGNEIYNRYLFTSIFIPYFSAISLFLLFIIFPFDKLKINIYYNSIKIISTYSGGIYYIHNKVKFFLDSIKDKNEKRTMKICIINYIICYNICLFGHFIFKKSDLRYLFI